MALGCMRSVQEPYLGEMMAEQRKAEGKGKRARKLGKRAKLSGNLLACLGRLDKQELETIGFALAPNRRIDPNSDAVYFLNRKEVIDALVKAGAVGLARKLQSKCRKGKVRP
jgi:hypothetical protein